MDTTTTRRQLLHTGAGLGGWLLLRPAQAADQLDEAIRAWTGGAPVQNGRVKLDIAPLVDNGNTVPLAVQVDSPMTAADHVVAIAVFNQRNPQADVLRFTLGPRAGRASVATRIRLATTQKLGAVARLSDGSYWQHTVEVIVTLAACLEELE
ncbi:SoxY-related AACIE arm protein [Rhodoferax sp. BAB1]|uniref:SoxY-related AACIE arm protein n=1 Tax=Rhodoferax sp. BAB1 TaxID=2741720 RepID=UPI00157505E8|nr:SoxY-related AACIE arm protein [Rhodoferax sp. BAB1]QKO20853.1 SoxY-related AACIE arm protein [Rhodoferax sp. BAB1]